MFSLLMQATQKPAFLNAVSKAFKEHCYKDYSTLWNNETKQLIFKTDSFHLLRHM